jgi:hypothetical protein
VQLALSFLARYLLPSSMDTYAAHCSFFKWNYCKYANWLPFSIRDFTLLQIWKQNALRATVDNGITKIDEPCACDRNRQVRYDCAMPAGASGSPWWRTSRRLLPKTIRRHWNDVCIKFTNLAYVTLMACILKKPIIHGRNQSENLAEANSHHGERGSASLYGVWP